MKAKLFVICLVCSFFTQVGSAQINLKRIIRKTENSINKRITKNIDKGVDNILDAGEDQVKDKTSKKKKKDKYSTKEKTKVIVEKEVVPFNFSGNITIDVETNGWQKNNLIKVVSDEFQMAVRPMLVKEPNNLMIYNKEEESITKINNEKYEGQALKEYFVYEQDAKAAKKTKIEKTSDIKDINGFVARKYIIDGKGYEGTAWLSPEVDIDFDLFSKIMNYKNLAIGTKYGFPLEMNLEFSNGDTLNFNVTDLSDGSPDKMLFDVSEYELIDMTDLK